MKSLRKLLIHLRLMLSLTPKQAEHLATLKFPCC